MPSKNYDVDFKKAIVGLYQSGKGVSELSREYGLAKLGRPPLDIISIHSQRKDTVI